MSLIVNLSELASVTQDITPGGSWADTGVNTGPTAPVLWDDDIDFTGFPLGVPYEYTYSVTPLGVCDVATSVITVIPEDHRPNVQDDCAENIIVALKEDSITSVSRANQKMAGECPGLAAATVSGEPQPTSWGAPTYLDMYYKILVAVGTSVTLNISVNSVGYPIDSQLLNPVLALYSGASCAALVEETSIGPLTLNFTELNYPLAAGSHELWARVGGTAANAGDFTINFTTT
jgi:hypothetical protein